MTASEREKLHAVIKQRFALDDAATDELIVKATAAEHESVDLYHFTHALNRALNERGRARVIEMMWEIVYADGQRDELEDNLLWRAADLLGVSPQERIALRRRIGGEASNRRGAAHEAGHPDHRRFGRHRRGTGARLCRARSRPGAGGAARGPARRRWPTRSRPRAGRGRWCWRPDLERRDAVARSPPALASRGLEPAIVVNNAGFGLSGRGRRAQRDEQLAMIDLNVRALTELSLAFVDSLGRHRGGILNVASVAAFLPGPGHGGLLRHQGLCAVVQRGAASRIRQARHPRHGALSGAGADRIPGPLRHAAQRGGALRSSFRLARGATRL